MRRRRVDAWLRAAWFTSLGALIILTLWTDHPGAADSATSPETRGRRLQGVSWDREIASRGEPGRRLVLQGTVRRSSGGKVLPGFIFFVYQADAQGRYGLPGPDSAKAQRGVWLSV